MLDYYEEFKENRNVRWEDDNEKNDHSRYGLHWILPVNRRKYPGNNRNFPNGQNLRRN